MNKCVVVGCNNNGLHKFPRDPEKKKRWEIVNQARNMQDDISSKICSVHYKTEDNFVKHSYTGLQESDKLEKDSLQTIDNKAVGESSSFKIKHEIHPLVAVQQQAERLEQNNLNKPPFDTSSHNEIAKFSQIKTKNEIKMENLEESPKDMQNMFASVWVKVEVEEMPPKTADSEPSIETLSSKPSNKNRKVLKCDVCDYTTPYKNCFDLHILGHSGKKPYSCTLCAFATKAQTSLQRHMMGQHHTGVADDVISFKCDQCDYTTFYKWNLNSHKRKHDKEKKYKCQHCSYITAYRHNFQKHSKTHAENTVFKCDKCPFKTKFQGHITRHLAKIHNEVTETAYRCNHCDFATIAKWRLTIHIQRSKQDNTLKCSYCDHETGYMCESKKHKSVHFSEIYKKKNTKDLNEKQAKKVEKESDDFEWSDHEDFFKEKTRKRKHTDDKQSYALDPDCIDWKNIQVLDSEDKTKPFQCIMCNYISRFKASVQRHFQRHHTGTQNRPYKCVNCNFSTKTKDQISLHNKRSQSNIAIICNECDFITTFKCQYVMHQKCHYTHKCDECEYACKNKYELQKHFTISHSGEVFECRFCEYKATRKDSLMCHETIHTGNKPFHCEHCSYTSVRKSFVDIHKKRYHGDIKEFVTVVSNDKIESLRIIEERKVESNLSGFKGLLTE